MNALVAAVAAVAAVISAAELLALLAGARPAPGMRSAPAVLRRIIPARRAGLPVPEDLAARIDAARANPALDVRFVMAVKVALAAVAGAAAFAVASITSGGPAVLLLMAVPVAGFLAPDAWLAARARRIQAGVLAEVPDVADRLHLAMSGGLAPARAAAVACAPGGGPLSSELAAAAGAVQAGVPLAGALDRLVRRCPVPEVRSLAAALVRSQGQGTDVAPFLEEIARDSRRRRALLLRDRAQKAGPKIQLAVALLLVPAAMALIAAALSSGLFSA